MYNKMFACPIGIRRGTINISKMYHSTNGTSFSFQIVWQSVQRLSGNFFNKHSYIRFMRSEAMNV